MQEPILDYNHLQVGQQFPAFPCPLDDAFVDAYLEATGEDHSLFRPSPPGGGYAPPLCTGLVRFVKGSLGGTWPTGTVHLSQEVRLLRPLHRGDSLALDVSVGQKEIRNHRRYIELITTTRDLEQRPVAQGAMLMLWAGATLPIGQRSVATASAGKPVTEQALPADGRPLAPITANFPPARLQAYGSVAAAQDPIHLDPQVAQQTRFGRNIAQGLLVLTLLSRLMTQAFGERWLASGTLQVRFVKPVFVDDRITAGGVGIASDETRCVVWCENQHGESVISGHATV